MGASSAPVTRHHASGHPSAAPANASHAFSREVNQVFDHDVLGGNYQGHFGDTEVRVRNVASAANHPVLAEVKPFTSLKMYKAGRLADETVVLQTGTIPDGDTHPVTWVHEYNGGRMFYTSLGVPRDFKTESFRQMLINAISWTAERDREAMKK
jgi:type 1 glutamine amidotransferase